MVITESSARTYFFDFFAGSLFLWGSTKLTTAAWSTPPGSSVGKTTASGLQKLSARKAAHLQPLPAHRLLDKTTPSYSALITSLVTSSQIWPGN